MNKYRSKGRDILFLSHQGTTGALSTTLELSDPERPVWRWDPENGERYRVPVSATGVLPLHLQPLESALLVVEQPGEDSGPDGVTGKTVRPSQTGHRQLGSEWTLDFRPVSGSPFRLVSAELFDFATHRDPAVSSFAGEVLYSTAFPADSENWQFIDLGIQKHVTELYLNGISLGTRWYGRHLYPIPEGRLKEGENVLEIRYTTSLANYAASLKDNPVARRWIRLEEPESMGLTGTVRLMTARETK